MLMHFLSRGFAHRSRLGVVAVAMGFAVTSGLTLFLNQPATAVADCLNGDYAFKGGVETASVTQLDNSGTRGDLYVPSGGVSCQHISSIYVGRAQGWAEFGWIRGWSSCTTGGADDVKYDRPTLFRWMRNTTGQGSTCRVFASRQPVSGWHSFRISDANENTYWGPFFDGEELEPNGIPLDFATGGSYLDMERGNSADPGSAQWRALTEHRNGAWSNWDSHSTHSGNHGPGSYQILSTTSSQANP